MSQQHVPPEERAQALTAYRTTGLAEACRTTGVPKSTLRRWAREAGMDPAALAGEAGERTRAATDASTRRAGLLRAELRELMVEKAVDLLERLDEPHIDWRGQVATKVEFDRPPADACRNYVTSAAILLDKVRLEAGEATDRSETLALERSTEADERLGKILELVTDRAS